MASTRFRPMAVSYASFVHPLRNEFFGKRYPNRFVPSITVITPSFNQGSFIQRTIESVLSQGIVDLEYIVMDGGSEDQTIEILKSYGDRIKWKSEHDAGTGDAVNKGLTAANGRIIGWLNSDDIYYDGTLRIALNYFKENPEADVLYGDANHINDLDEIIEKYPTEPWSWERRNNNVLSASRPHSFVALSLN